MKRLILALTLLLILSSVSYASPLMDYSQGKMAFDFTFRNIDMDGKAGIDNLGTTSSYSIDGKNSFEWGITAGLGKNLAFQYRQFNPSSKTYRWSGDERRRNEIEGRLYLTDAAISGKIRSEEYNIMYNVNKQVSLFTGLVRGVPELRGSVAGWVCDEGASAATNIKGFDKNIWQFGVLGNYKIADKTNLYGVVSFGNDYRNWETGIGYELSKNVEFNINYRSTKFKKLDLVRAAYAGTSYNAGLRDLEAKGLGFGLTIKY